MSNPNPPGTPPDAIAAVINQVQNDKQIPLEVNLATGQVYKGDTPQDLLNKLAAAQEEATRTIRSRESENAEMRQRLASLEAEAQQRRVPESPDQTKNNEYYQTWSSNPNKATTMALANELGIPADQLVPALKKSMASSAITSASSEFLARCQDFPETPENANLIRQGIEARYGANPNALTADNLELVYHDLVRNGKIQPKVMQSSAVNEPNVPFVNIRGGSAPPNQDIEIMQKIQTMPLDQLREVMERMYAQQKGKG